MSKNAILSVTRTRTRTVRQVETLSLPVEKVMNDNLVGRAVNLDSFTLLERIETTLKRAGIKVILRSETPWNSNTLRALRDDKYAYDLNSIILHVVSKHSEAELELIYQYIGEVLISRSYFRQGYRAANLQKHVRISHYQTSSNLTFWLPHIYQTEASGFTDAFKEAEERLGKEVKTVFRDRADTIFPILRAHVIYENKQ